MVDQHRRVVWTEVARTALGDAADHIALDSPAAAREVVVRILKAAESLQTLAMRGRMVPELSDPRIRELVTKPFRLIYRVRDAEVVIITLLHEARDFERWRSEA